MKPEEDDTIDDISALLRKIGRGAKKDEGSPRPEPAQTVPESGPGGSGTTGEGDFSELMKRLAAGKKEEPVPSAAKISSDVDDLLEDSSSTSFSTRLPDKSSTGAQKAPAKIPENPDQPAARTIHVIKKSTAAEARPARTFRPPVRIIEENTREAPASSGVPKAAETSRPAGVPETEADERIVNVDQISDLSGLILPKGATFKVDELKLHGRINAFESSGTGTLPPELDEIWKREFSSVGFKDLDIGAEIEPETAGLRLPAVKKFGLSFIFRAIRQEVVDYNPRQHGPLVDLVSDTKPGIEEMEMYPVNEPYAYVRILYDHATHEYTYQVIEPVLSEPEKDLLKELKERLFETLDINTKDISKEEARRQLRAAVDDILADYGLKLNPVQREKILYNMHKDFLGDGLIDAIMHDKYIEDISCDGVNTPIFAFHASYESMKTTLMYHNAEELDSFVTKLAQRAGKYISIAEPILDATMGDGSRIQMTLGHEVTAHGSTFTIRKFKDEPITPTDLIEWHTYAPLSLAYIWLAVENGKSAIFAGGTASGKTTSLNAISLFIPPMAKIVSLEDTREVKLPHPNWIPSVTRDSFDAAGRGEINMYELLRAAMRQRPEYIIVGEVRGRESQTLFQAMSTGHVTYSTIHADSVSSVVHRIENPPMDVPRNMLSALDFVCVQVQARVGGKRIRRNKQIVEILDIDPRTNELITNEVFKWRSATDEINYSGKSYILEEIMEARGWNESRMREELKRRQEVLEWMRIKKIRHYKDVAKILISYYREPEVVIERVRKDLYE